MNRSAGVHVRMPSAARPGGAPVPCGRPCPALPPLHLSWAAAGLPALARWHVRKSRNAPFIMDIAAQK